MGWVSGAESGHGDGAGSSSSSTSSSSSSSFTGSEEDLAHHRGNTQCWQHFDFGWLDGWDATVQTFCSSRSAADGSLLVGIPPKSLSYPPAPPASPASSSWLRCRVMRDDHLPRPTAPHTMCDGANIVVDVSRMSPTTCLPSRQGYKCEGEAVHWLFAEGALSGACERTPPFVSTAFPADHLVDMFAGFKDNADGKEVASAHRTGAEVVLVIARERAEHANPFHSTTDFLNAFFTLHNAGVINGHTGSREGMDKVQVLLFDEQKGPFEETFLGPVFSPSFPVLRVSSLKGQGQGALPASAASRLLLPRALFVPPGYTNMLLAHVTSEGDCHAGTHLFQSFRRFVLSAFKLDHLLEGKVVGDEERDPVTVTFISRRPYTKFVEHSFIGRQVDNEEQLIAAMSGVPGAKVTRYDFAQLPVSEQVEVMASTEVLVGMHGAALTFALYMPHHGSVVEMWPKDHDMWRVFEHISAMCGLEYRRWENPNPGAFRTDSAGDYTRVDIGQFLPMFEHAVKKAKERRGSRMEYDPGGG